MSNALITVPKAAKRGEDDHSLPETVRFVIALLLGHPEAPQ